MIRRVHSIEVPGTRSGVDLIQLVPGNREYSAAPARACGYAIGENLLWRVNTLEDTSRQAGAGTGLAWPMVWSKSRSSWAFRGLER